MRRTFLASAIALVVAGAGCGGGDGSVAPRKAPLLDQDYAGNFTGTWEVAGSLQLGSASQQSSGSQRVTSPERNVLLYEGGCPDGSPLRAVVTSASTCEFDHLSCVEPESCGPVTITFQSGSGLLAQGRLSVTLQGTASGCGQSMPFTMSFSGTRIVSNPVPTIASLDPSTATAGDPGFGLVVTGTGFVAGSTVSWNGTPRPTSFVSASELHASISAADIASARSATVVVLSPAPGGGASNASTFTVANPVPSLTALRPTSAATGGPRFTLTVTGRGFLPASKVTWNGSARTTTFVSAGQLRATIEAADIAATGTAQVSVDTLVPGGGVSTQLPFSIATVDGSALGTAVAYQIDPGHAGRAVFGTALSFPDQPTWSVTLGGPISYPLIAGGKVFVLTGGLGTGNGYGTQLYALDPSTGGIAWGPVAITGTYFWAGHAYDNGKIFVVNFDGLLRSFDAATGQAGWSVKLPGQYAFSAPPTAANGVVYVGGSGSGGTVYAVDEANGAVLWTSPVANGDDSSPAVTTDGVFVAYPCQVYKLDLATGAPIWHVAGGCSGGGGKTAAYANASVYVRDPYDTNPVGTIYDAFSGTPLGSFGTGTGWMPIPAFGADAGFFSTAGTLRRADLSGQDVAWSFAGDGSLTSAPIVIDGVVIVGSGSGNVYAIDAATGLQTWVGSAGAAIPPPDEQNVSQPLTGLAAGEGYLVVPAGSTLTAWRIVAP